MQNTTLTALLETTKDQNINSLNRDCSECRILVITIAYLYSFKKEQATLQYTCSDLWETMLSEKSKVKERVLYKAKYCSSKKSRHNIHLCTLAYTRRIEQKIIKTVTQKRRNDGGGRHKAGLHWIYPVLQT